MRPGLCEDALRLARVLSGVDARRARSPRAWRRCSNSRARVPRARDRASGEPILLLGIRIARWWDRILMAARPRRARACRTSSAAAPVRTRCRPAIAAGRTRRRPPPRIPTGRTSPRSTRSLPRYAPSPGRRTQSRRRRVDGRRTGRRARRDRRTARRRRARAATTCCRACAATCWPSSAAPTEARAEFERAAELTSNEAERSHLLARAGRSA